MELHKIVGFLDVNIYFLVNNEQKTAVIIDCGTDAKIVNKKASELGVKISHLLLTHSHYDHSGCAGELQRQGVKVYVSEKDALKLNNSDNLAYCFNKEFDSFTPDGVLYDDQVLELNEISIKVKSTPGHTDGSVSFVVDNFIFSGDTLFYNSVGRTDFPTGDFNQLKNSVLNLYALDGDFVVYAGHGRSTTLENERKYNSFVKL